VTPGKKGVKLVKNREIELHPQEVEKVVIFQGGGEIEFTASDPGLKLVDCGFMSEPMTMFWVQVEEGDGEFIDFFPMTQVESIHFKLKGRND